MEENSDDENIEITNISDKKPIKKNRIIRIHKTSEHKKLIDESEIYPKHLTQKYNYVFKKIRNTYIISEDQDGHPVLTVGPEWIYYILLSLAITSGFLFLFFRFYQFTPTYLFILGIIVYTIFITVYTKLFITDPGFPRKVDKYFVVKARKRFLYCHICEKWVLKKPKIKHCKRCGMCIEEYDHHCDWIGKCVGSKNMMLFYFFVIWVVMVILYFIAAFVIVHDNWFEYQKYLRQIEKMKNTENQ